MDNTGYGFFFGELVPHLRCICLSEASGVEIEKEERTAELSDNTLHVS